MCYKQRWDGSGHYSVYPEFSDRATPLIHEDAAIIAAICMDIQNPQRFGDVAMRASEAQKRRNFVCMPAAMSDTSWFGGATQGSYQGFLQRELKEKGNPILAKSDQRGIGSIITGSVWRVLTCIEGPQKSENQLLIAHPDGQTNL